MSTAGPSQAESDCDSDCEGDVLPDLPDNSDEEVLQWSDSSIVWNLIIKHFD